MQKDLILSYATYAEYSGLRILLASARKFCPASDVDIAVIINPMGAKYAELADEFGAQFYPANSIWKEIKTSKQMKAFYRLVLWAVERTTQNPSFFGPAGMLDAVHRCIAYPWIYAQAQRFLAFEDFLKVRCNYRNVFLTDARDVVIQENPFTHIESGKLHVALQSDADTYGEPNLDSTWMKEVIGEATLTRLRGKIASCCGTTVGGYAVMMEYLEKMTASILRGKYRPIEQPMHNEIIYLNFPPERLAMHTNKGGYFLTLGGLSASDFQLDNGEVKVDGKLVPIVHMYDRVPETKALFASIYPEPAAN